MVSERLRLQMSRLWQVREARKLEQSRYLEKEAGYRREFLGVQGICLIPSPNLRKCSYVL